jgi:large subunit ribosomal protein L2
MLSGAAAPPVPLRGLRLLLQQQHQQNRGLAAMTNVTRANRLNLSVEPGTLPHAELKSYKPVTPSLRHRVVIDKSHLWPGRPVKKLTKRIKSHAGRNNTGRITVRGRCAPKHRRLYRQIDFKRTRDDAATVRRFEYDPNRSAFIALIQYESDGALSYILAPRDLAVGATVRCGDEAPFAPGNAMELQHMPDGSEVHNIELIPGRGAEMVRAAGTAARLMSKDEAHALLKLPSGEIRYVHKRCRATIGMLSNDQWQNRMLGKAGASRWVGRRPKVRGVAMNPVDHPMGGGEGKSSGGRPSTSPWGWYTKGLRTRNTKKHSSKLIVRRRNHDELGLSTINTGGW